MSRLSLAQQLKQLEEDEAPRSIDPESAYTSLDGLDIPAREGDEGREHYLDVGPSKLRAQREEIGQTLLGDKYAGATRGRVKIFDDDEDDEDEEEDEEDEEDEDEDGEEEDGDEEEADEEEGDESDDDDEDGEQGSEDEEDDNVEEHEEDDAEEAGIEAPIAKAAPASSGKPSKALDPMGSLKEARQKDVQKGKGIKKQKALFDSLITLRITFQKALTASTTLPYPIPADPAGEVEEQRLRALRSLAELNERLLDLRTKLVLPGTEVPQLGKRKRGDEDPDEAYWTQAAKDSFAITDANHPQILGILHKWSSKINAASLAVTSKAAGSSKFLQSTKGQLSIEDAIQAGITSRVESDKTFMESEESGYRLLLKEVIESRSGGAGGADLTHLRREKKKKREAERGGSKGRKLKYTVHEKAQNFMVPLPLSHGWHDEQIDELFSSLLGGAGMRGAGAETAVNASGMINGDEGLASLGGLRVF